MAIFTPTHRFTRRLCITASARQALDDWSAAEQDAAAERNQWNREWIERHEPERCEATKQTTQHQPPMPLVPVVSEQESKLSVDERLPDYRQEVLDLLKDMLESIDTCKEPESEEHSSSTNNNNSSSSSHPSPPATVHQPTTPTHPLLGDIFDTTYLTLTQEQHSERTQDFPGVWYRSDPLPAPRPLRPWLGETAEHPEIEGISMVACQQGSEGAVFYVPAELVRETADMLDRAGDEGW